MLTDSRLVYLMIYVNDLTVSRAFYEDVLGFRVLEEDPDAVKYDAGHLILCLNRAQDFGITLPERDRSAYMAFLVDDLDAMRAALEQRGVVFSPTERYDVGATTDFYDPDGHWFALYEPSERALTWPSADKIMALRNAGGDGVAAETEEPLGLDGKDLVYLFMFVGDREASYRFYHETLGLRNVEGGACQQGVTLEIDGVIKYDTGGAFLTTHHIEPADAQQRLDPATMKGLAPVFHVEDIRHTVEALAEKGVRFSYGPATSTIGTIAQFEDPAGHVYYLYEPSEEALRWPSGAKIEHILAASL